MPSPTRKFGDEGERAAVDFLINGGYKIIDRNFRVKNLGEIDIIGEKKNKLIFFEVKTRDLKHETDFPIQTSIGFKKKNNLKRICQIYLNDKHVSQKDWQVDAIFVSVKGINDIAINHLENILWEEYY